MILQLGCILHSVPAWKRAFQLRVLVFVEYESEVKEEQARLKVLLEKLRIDATIQVFWLASGQLESYETIVNGRGIGSGYGRIVNELLKDDEWWQELQRLRTEAHEMSRSQELASLEQMLSATRRRGSSVSSLPRGLDVNEMLERSKKPSVSAISKLGINFGIHTHQLSSSGFGVRTNINTPDISDDDGESITSSDADFNDVTSPASIDVMEDLASSRRPSFLTFAGRRKSHGDIMQRAAPPRSLEQTQDRHLEQQTVSTSSGYGTMPPMTGAVSTSALSNTERTQSLASRLGTTAVPSETSPIIPKTPSRPALSRHSSASRFTSNPTPETTVLVDDSGPRITFSEGEQTIPTGVRCPIISRNAPAGPFSSRPVPETTVEAEEDHGPRLTFAEPERGVSEPPLRSRRNSVSRNGGLSGAQFNIPELLASHRSSGLSDEDTRSSYSTQNLPLSFNDLPSRAQHLILNELMRQKSSDTAVILTTLPIPEEGTCKSEEASLRYLTDIEVLCHELPPVLLVLSNNMTVTVSL